MLARLASGSSRRAQQGWIGGDTHASIYSYLFICPFLGITPSRSIYPDAFRVEEEIKKSQSLSVPQGICRLPRAFLHLQPLLAGSYTTKGASRGVLLDVRIIIVQRLFSPCSRLSHPVMFS